MYVFYGSINEKIFQEYSRKQSLRLAIVFSVAPILGTILSIIFGILKSPVFLEILILTILCFIVWLLIIFTPTKSIIPRLPITNKFNINENLISIEIQGLKEKYSKPKIKRISRIKSILDYGDWYLICFKFDITNTLVIQKDLIVEGTIEEFEELFKDKIIKKYNKEKQD